jgi:hypothetical protein
MDSPHRGGRESIRLYLGPTRCPGEPRSGRRKRPALYFLCSHLQRCPTRAANGQHLCRNERHNLGRWSPTNREASLMTYLAPEIVVPV